MSHSTLLRQRHCLPSARFGLARAAALVRLCRLRRPLRSVLVVLANSSFGALLSLSLSLSFSLYLSPSLVLSGAPFRAATLLLPLNPRISPRRRFPPPSSRFSPMLSSASAHDPRLSFSPRFFSFSRILAFHPPPLNGPSVRSFLSVRVHRSLVLFLQASASLCRSVLVVSRLPLAPSSAVCRVLFPIPRSLLVTPRPPRFPALSLSDPRRRLVLCSLSWRALARAHTRAVAYRRSACLPELFRHR